MDALKVQANGIEIAYETFGDPADPAMLLIMGLGTQMIGWPDPLCTALADQGYYVIRFDNRDVGLSTHFRDERAPSLLNLLLKRAQPPYTIADMADDTVGLLDALGIETTHVFGLSMGSFIAQTLALRQPHRVRSLTLMMTSTGAFLVGYPKPALFARMLRRRVAADRSEAQAMAVETFRIIGSRGYAFDEERFQDLAGRSYDRAYDPGGYVRQLAAVLSQPNRTAQLRQITAPTLVMHGLHDPLVTPSGGVATARAIPNARFVGFSGMGHDLPQALWPRFAKEVSEHAASAERRRATAGAIDLTEAAPQR